MPRGKTFDPEEKLDQALDLFWRQGCDAVSIQDLVDTLDLNRGSLYGTYGDKEQLWQRALTRYCEQRRVHLAAFFDDPTEPVLPRVRSLMLENSPTPTPNSHAAASSSTPSPNAPTTLRPWTLPSDTSTMWKTYCAKLSPEPARAERSPPHRLRDGSPASSWSALQGLHVYDRAMADPRRTRDAVEVAL